MLTVLDDSCFVAILSDISSVDIALFSLLKATCLLCLVFTRDERKYAGKAEPVTDLWRIAGFIELRLKRNPFMSRLIMRLFDGLPLRFNRATLEGMAAEKALVILHLSGE